ncbi:hypothetical protein ACO2Q3_12170 [Caulobacter sp. KR2-114]|uniref:hypothetical protein n=1 Tax=Caulobacter sp. KR2-114 TaxID=3400912 RepID=UPI003C0697ED
MSHKILRPSKTATPVGFVDALGADQASLKVEAVVIKAKAMSAREAAALKKRLRDRLMATAGK